MRKRILAVMGVTVMVLGMTTSVGAEEAKADLHPVEVDSVIL